MAGGLLRVLTQDTCPAGFWDEKTRLALGLGFSGWHQSACLCRWKRWFIRSLPRGGAQ